MSKSLLLECDPIDQPAAVDPVERATWCSLRIRVGDRYASTVWDKSLQSERKSLYVPAFPVAEWLVQNWWALLNELCPWDRVPNAAVSGVHMPWIKRHCLRSADSSLMLPAMYLFHDGRGIRTIWLTDPQGSMPNLPGEFVAAGDEQLDAQGTQESLAQFIDNVLGRVANVEGRSRELVSHWREIQSADVEEQKFCKLAGRMGIDPYDPCEMPDELASFLEETFTSPDDPLVRDLTEVARPESIKAQWSWLKNVSEALKLGPNLIELPFELPSSTSVAPQFGYQLARKVRVAAGMDDALPLGSIEVVAEAVLGRRFRFEEPNHVPGHGIRAIIGQARDTDVVMAGPALSRPDNRRFMMARGVYLAIVTSRASQRLVTDSYSWDQKASRAFAAELLAPQAVLKRRLKASIADQQFVEDMGREFSVSRRVIENQLENAGLPLSFE